MATAEQRARRRAQRQTAKSVREFKAAKKAHREPVRRLPKQITQRAREAATKYAYSVLNGVEPYPAKGTLEAHQLARMASMARHGKADPQFLTAFQQYFYHDEKNRESDEADEEYEPEDEEEEEE